MRSGNLVKQLTVPVYRPADRRNTSLASYNTGFSVANTWYNSMAATVRRPFQNGFEVLANYTWAHASDTGQVQGANGTFYGGDVPLDPNNIRGENGLSDTDIRNRFTAQLRVSAAHYDGQQDRQERCSTTSASPEARSPPQASRSSWA